MLTESPLWSWVVSIPRPVVPQSQPEWIALRLFIVFLVAVAIQATLFAFFGGSFWLTLFYPVFTITALGGGIAAVVAVVRHGDRGFLLILPLIVLLAALAFVVAEVVAPHD